MRTGHFPTLIFWSSPTNNNIVMSLNTTPPLNFEHRKGFEIPTKHKEAIRQLHWFGKAPIWALIIRYKLGDTMIKKVLGYPTPERRRPNRNGPSFLLSNTKVDKIILYCARSWEHHIIQWPKLREELGLNCSVDILKRRLNTRGYHHYITCQKPFLNLKQVAVRFI